MENRIDSSSSSSSNDNNTSKEAPTLLEHLRNHPGETTHAAEWSNETCTQLRRRVLEHQSEFPSVIRNKIDLIARDEHQGSIEFMERLNDSIQYFLSPPRYLDSDVDLEEELEVAIRLFPTSLQAAHPRWRSHTRCPISMSMHYVNKRPFVPVFVELGYELGVFGDQQEPERRKEHPNGKDAWPLEELFCDREMYDLGQNREEYHRQLDITSLSVMVRLKERGFLLEKDVQKYIRLILFSEHSRTQKRFRFLLHWIPSLLNVTQSHHPLLSDYLKGLNPAPQNGNLDRFQSILELGILYYPKEIGFLFHDSLDPRFDSNFDAACHKFGTQVTTEVTDTVLVNFAYHLCRRNPMAWVRWNTPSRPGAPV